MRVFYAYQNRWGSIYVHEHDHAAIVEAATSPSVVWLCRFIEADNLIQAQTDAKILRENGGGEITFAGQNRGISKAPEDRRSP